MKGICSVALKTGALGLFALLPAQVQADYSFDPGFFRGMGIAGSTDVDLSLFNQGSTFPPGEYLLAVYINGEFIIRQNIHFIRSLKGGDPFPCLSAKDTAVLGINYTSEENSVCQVPENLPDFLWKTDMNSRRLSLTLPQLYLQNNDYFTTSPRSWQAGEPALLMNYDYSYSDTRSGEQTDTSQYLGLQGGVNLLGWRLRNESTWSRTDSRESPLSSLRTYIQRDYAWGQGGEFTAGQAWSDGNLFESVPFRGVMLSSRDDMLRSQFRNYTPAIRGVVNSQSATVSVIKNNRVIYQTNLPAGPFSLDGIMDNGGGDYLIQIKEADGSIRSYSQSADSLPVLQTKGRLKYNIVSGVSDFAGTDDSYFSQAVLYYGAGDRLTLYGGGLLSSGYSAWSAGTGLQIDGLGAVSADLTLSSTGNLPGGRSLSGQSARASWYRDFDATGTSFGLFAYRYSSRDYMSFEEALRYQVDGDNPPNRKNRFDLSVVQSLGEAGNLSVTGRRESYWSGEKNLTGVRVNHNIGFGRVSLNTWFDQSRTVDNKEDKIAGMSVSVALYEKGRGVSLSSRLSGENGRLTSQNSVNISPTEDGRFALAASTGKTEGKSSLQGLQVNYSGSLSEMSAGYYSGGDNHRLNAGIRGGLVAHGRGITAGRRLSMEAPVAVISTPGISGVRISSRANVETDYFGNAIVSNLQPYQKNQLSLDVTSLKPGVDVTETDRTIVPARGGVIPVIFGVSAGERALFKVMYRSRPVPMGAVASVKDAAGNDKTAFFADQGQVYMTGMNTQGVVRVNWGNASCQFSYDTGGRGEQVPYNNTVECR
ncbi:fimbrial biogenesis outer membrane usher protein [Salmonella enterica]|nr:fimbrial biogenesis outer membrane usher protein [Salmonella enterica]ELL0185240.1 fimbrial biogenesis outer membrane usher protein [Salmonella enterica]